MAYSIDPLIFEQFKGIREYNGVASGGMISAISSYNTELFASDIGSGTGIKSMPGNACLYNFNTVDGYTDFVPYGIWESNQFGTDYQFIYAENDSEGAIFYLYNNEITLIKKGLAKNDGKCNGLTMTSSAYDVFIFTNGEEMHTICFPLQADMTAYKTVVTDHNPTEIKVGSTIVGYMADIDEYDPIETDASGNKIKIKCSTLAMCDWNGFLVVGTKYGVRASNQSDVYDWNDNPDPDDLTTSWYVNFSKKVTALYAFTGGLYIFTSDDITFLNTTPNDTTNSKMTTSAGNGTMSYTSICKHDLYLFFYDHNQRNIYYLSATDTTGQTKPTGPVAKEIQSHFEEVNTMKMFSCVYGVRNEIWCFIDDEIMIFDYLNQEWTVRQEQKINYAAVISNHIYTCATSGKILIENKNNDFDGECYPCFYQTTYINAGSNSNLKKQKTPLLITVNDNHTNDFFVQLVINYKEKNPKTVKLACKNDGIYATEGDESIYSELETNDKYAYTTESGDVVGAYYPAENNYSKKVIEISTPQTWYSMSIRVYTETSSQGFYITSMELKNIKGKTKTKGR